MSQDSFSNESEVSKIDKQRVRFTGVEEGSVVETPKCPTCLQVIPKDTKDFDSLMEKSVTMVTMSMAGSTPSRCGALKAVHYFLEEFNQMVALIWFVLIPF